MQRLRVCVVGSGPAGFYATAQARRSAKCTHPVQAKLKVALVVQLLKQWGDKVAVNVVVGMLAGGPAGACKLAQTAGCAQDRLFAPYGLVRSGVAPDHQDTKVRGTAPAVHLEQRPGTDPASLWLQNVINQFARTGQDPRVSFFGNVHVGTDIGLAELRKAHHAVRMPLHMLQQTANLLRP